MHSSWRSLVPVPPSHDPQLLKGVLSLVLLQLLAEQESYGYEVVQRLHSVGLTDVLERLVSARTKMHELERLLPWNAEQFAAAGQA